MKLKDLVGKTFEISLTTDLFDEDDIERVGGDYEVTEEEIATRLHNLIEGGELSLQYSNYKYKMI